MTDDPFDHAPAYDEGYLDGAVWVAGQLSAALSQAEHSDPKLQALARELGDRLWSEIVGCGDVVPQEIPYCWETALEAAGFTVPELVEEASAE